MASVWNELLACYKADNLGAARSLNERLVVLEDMTDEQFEQLAVC